MPAHAALDPGEIANQQPVSRRSADHGARYVADDLKRLRIDFGDMCQITGRNRDPLRLDVSAVTLEILRLRPVPGPSAGASAVIPQCATHPAVTVAPGEQRADFGGRGVCGAETEFNDTTDDRIEPLAPQRMLKSRLA
jgi:hypothetical protein